MAMIIWTRALDDWAEDQDYLKTKLEQTIHLPSISCSGIPFTVPNMRPDIAVFTSANAVSFGLQDTQLCELMEGVPEVYVVGPKTQMALDAHGIASTVPSNVQNAQQMSAWLTEHLDQTKSVLWPCSPAPSFDLVQALKEKNIQVTPLIVYRTLKQLTNSRGTPLSPQELQIIQMDPNVIVCFASPSAVESFATAMKYEHAGIKKSWIACCIGPTTAIAAKAFFESTVSAPSATAQDLAKKALELFDAKSKK